MRGTGEAVIQGDGKAAALPPEAAAPRLSERWLFAGLSLPLLLLTLSVDARHYVHSLN